MKLEWIKSYDMKNINSCDMKLSATTPKKPSHYYQTTADIIKLPLLILTDTKHLFSLNIKVDTILKIKK